MRPIDRYVDAWRRAVTDVLALGRDLTAAQWTASTGCPKWTVADLYAHLIGGELWMRDGGGVPDVPFDRFVQDPVNARRSRPRDEVLDELDAVLRRREEQLAADALDPDRPASAGWGQPITYEVQLRHRAFDSWVHEQDIRWAVGAPATLASPGAKVARETFLEMLPRTVAKAAGAPPNSLVRITVVGPLGWDATVHVDAEGRGRLGPTSSRPEPIAHLTLSWPEYVVRACGRTEPRPPDPVWISGDDRLAERIVAALPITP
jgi:uncharacterized protein (TIGR03083 family)